MVTEYRKISVLSLKSVLTLQREEVWLEMSQGFIIICEGFSFLAPPRRSPGHLISCASSITCLPDPLFSYGPPGAVGP